MGKPEAKVEEYFRKRVEEEGGFYRKVVYQGRKGSPDDWAFFPDGRLLIVECKAFGKEPNDIQHKEIHLLRNHGFYVGWVSSRMQVDFILNQFKRYSKNNEVENFNAVIDLESIA